MTLGKRLYLGLGPLSREPEAGDYLGSRREGAERLPPYHVTLKGQWYDLDDVLTENRPRRHSAAETQTPRA